MSDPQEKGFTPEVLDKTIIAIPLLKILEKESSGAQAAAGAEEETEPTPKTHPVIIDLNLLYPIDGRKGARERVEKAVQRPVQILGWLALAGTREGSP